MKIKSATKIGLLLILLLANIALAQEKQSAPASPKAPWGEFEVVKEEEPTTLTKVLLWLPNRLLDFVDIFRVDAGVGLATGAVVRITKYGQAGIITQSPGMLRIGDFGRASPLQVETTNEIGFGPAFKSAPERNLCPGIVGAGIDLVIVGAHIGFCPEELVDFALGIFTIDIMKDDLK